MFLENMANAAGQVLILYILVAVGFISDRLKVFTESTAKLSNNLLFYCVTPAVILNSFISMEFTPEKALSLAIAFLCAVGTMIVGMIFSAPFFKNKGDDRAIYQFAVIYGNMGYMALPLAQALLGDEGVFYCSAGVMAFNTVCFTHGVWLMSKPVNGKKAKFELLNIFKTPGVISVLIGLPLFVVGVKMPHIIAAPLNYLAGMNTPLAMIFFGTYIANTDIKRMLFDKGIYLVGILKLILIPFIMFGIYKSLGISGTLLTACMISASAPSANNTVMFAAKYDHNTQTASKVVALVSFLSILTMPLMIVLSS